MGHFVIAAYRPKPDRAQQLRALVQRHASVLRAEGLITGRPAHVMCAADGTVVEVCEWASTQAIDQAHRNAAVQALWAEFATVCDHVPLAELREARHSVAEFDALP